MTLEQNYYAALSRLESDPRNSSLVRHIERYVEALHEEIQQLEATHTAHRAAHKAQQLSELMPQALEQIEAVCEKYQLQFYEEI